ncbi:metal-dependent hydrolase [Thiohalocapsa marina]|uniref:Metal-dependent hydrolase n=1 Tax=Thiohalocapsa marina TaxID=424902 RepID=A0A5M8FNX5_9GAMM|nr:metal-dependent hydrolase [Thiohalocapsa marina]KAA6184115.1 metal-dependent hydrolase [Thiohalocapsa marina]
MANFQAHLIGGAIASSTLSLGCFDQGLTDSSETLGLFVLGVASSLLPDIDADDSKPIRAVFDLGGIVLGFLVAFAFAGRLKVIDLLLLWFSVWALTRWPLRLAFARLTVHRGIWHTLLMALVLALLAVVLADTLLGADARLAWLAGGFTLLGYVTHLVLDEAASVDLFGRRVKRSFGTALKPLSLRAWPASLSLMALVYVLLGLTPDPGPVLAVAGHLGVDAQRLADVWPRW